MQISSRGVILSPQEWEQLVDMLGAFQVLHNSYYKGKRPSDEIVSQMYNVSLDALDILNGTKEFSKMKDEVTSNG